MRREAKSGCVPAPERFARVRLAYDFLRNEPFRTLILNKTSKFSNSSFFVEATTTKLSKLIRSYPSIRQWLSIAINWSSAKEEDSNLKFRSIPILGFEFAAPRSNLVFQALWNSCLYVPISSIDLNSIFFYFENIFKKSKIATKTKKKVLAKLDKFFQAFGCLAQCNSWSESKIATSV